MVSPLFRTLQIATLRYRHEDVNIVKSEIYSNVELEYNNETLACELDDKAHDIDLQNNTFSIELENSFELVFETDEIEYSEDC